MYQVVLTRLLSVTAWYYLAFVAISMSMFGLTAGALRVHLQPAHFPPEAVPRRTAQAAWGMAVSIPLTLLTMLAIPLELSYALQTVFSFILFSAVVSVPLSSPAWPSVSPSRVTGRRSAAPTPSISPARPPAASALSGRSTLLDAPSAFLAVSALVSGRRPAGPSGRQPRGQLSRPWPCSLPA